MATSERLIIKDVILVSMDDSIGNHRRASILIDDGRIAAIGRDIEADGAQVIDAQGRSPFPVWSMPTDISGRAPCR